MGQSLDWHNGGMPAAITLTSTFNRVAAVLVWVLAAVLVVTAITSDDARFLFLYPAAGLLTLFGWVGLWRPFVRVTDEGVTVQNVTHSVFVPWEALVHVDTRYALTLHTPAAKYAAWSAPAPGMLGSIRARRNRPNREARASGEHLRAGDLIGTESGDAATVVRERWNRRLRAGGVETGIADQVSVRRHWDVPTIAGIALLTAATIGALAVA